MTNAANGLTRAKLLGKYYLLDSAPDALLVLDSDGLIVVGNRAAEVSFGIERAALVGRSVESLIPARFHTYHPELRENFMRNPVPRAMGAGRDVFALRADGTEFPVEIDFSPVVLEPDSAPVLIVSVRDISALKLVERELAVERRDAKTATAAARAYLANMSHELRSPLSGIIGFAELLQDERLGPVSAQQKEYLRLILESATYLQRIIADVLDMWRAGEGHMTIEATAVAIEPIVRGVCDGLRPFAERQGVLLHLSVSTAARHVMLDGGRFKQILYNYLSNAIKFSDGGIVWVTVRLEKRLELRLDVRDMGVGISPENLGRLFVEGEQLDTSAATQHQGSGLGLALTKRIVEAMGGRVEVRSTLGRGSVFSAMLPFTPITGGS